MSHRDKTKFGLILFGACGTLLLLAAGCREMTLTRATETPPITTPTPTPTLPPRPTPPPCCVHADFPPVCDILPGRSTREEVERVLGAPVVTRVIRLAGLDIPAAADTDTCWIFDGDCPVDVVLSNEIVSVVGYAGGYRARDISLQEAVAVYGPPEKVLAIWFDDVEAYPVVAFLWPAEGVIMVASPAQPIEQPHDLPPFGADLAIAWTWYFQPVGLGEAVSTYFDGASVLVEWPGMTE